MKKLLFVITLFPFIVFSQGNLSAIPTFNCVSLYYSGHGQPISAVCKVQYRKVGETLYRDGLDAWGDSRAIGNRPSNEFRSSVIGLEPGTTYEFLLTTGTASQTTTATTWSESFPVISTTTLSSPTTISTSGTPTGYRVYNGNINGGSNNLIINASYIIIRGMNLSNATNDAIVLQQNAHDIIIEGCDISKWGQSAQTLGGNNQGAIRVMGFSYNATNVSRIIIQRNKIHDPTFGASAWDAGNTHPYGVNGINFEEAGQNIVIRYNSFYSVDGKKMMDICGGANNFTTTGFPGPNSDIYGNYLDGAWDDGVESEGNNCNVRIWGNFLNNTFTGIATATVSVGPCYVFNNITNVGQRLNTTNTSTLDNEDRGPFNKCGSQDASVRGGRIYLFHNTVLQPKQTGFANSRGLDGGIVDNGGQVTNVVSKNNIWTTAYTGKGGYPIAFVDNGNNSGANSTSTNDLTNVNTSSKKGQMVMTGTIVGAPIYNSSVPLTLDTNGYFLASNSPGKGKAIRINNFNESDNADVGAYNGKRLEFGVNAYLNVTPPPPVNLPPTATASAIPTSITLPTNSITLNGTGADSDGSIILYAWSEVSGKTNYSLGTPNSPTTTASNLIAGTYRFRLTVTDNQGATGFAEVNIIVNPAPPDPITIKAVYQTIVTKYSDSTIQTNKIIFK